MKIAVFKKPTLKRLANLLAWLRRARPAVACLQLKTTDGIVPIAAIEEL
jgi:hypothetical protein